MLKFRLLGPDDIPAVMEIMVQPHVIQGLMLEDRPPLVHEVAAAMTMQEPGTRTEAFGAFGPDGKLLATVVLAHQHPIHQTGTITNLAVRQGAGWYVAVAVCHWIVRHAFVNRNLRRVDCSVFEGNAITPAIVKRFPGAQLDGVRRKAIWRLGRYIDIALYSLLREEWKHGVIRTGTDSRNTGRVVAIRTGESAERLAGRTATA